MDGRDFTLVVVVREQVEMDGSDPSYNDCTNKMAAPKLGAAFPHRKPRIQQPPESNRPLSLIAFRSPIRFADGADIQPEKSSCCFGILAETRSSPERTLQLSFRRGQISRGYGRQWSSSPREMENDVCKFSYLDAHRPSSLTSLTEDTKFAIEDTNNHSFVNQGAIIWNEMRRQWVGDSSKTCRRMPSEPSISWFSTYDDLLSTTQPFPQPISLSEMVDFLVDFWHEEGLYD